MTRHLWFDVALKLAITAVDVALTTALVVVPVSLIGLPHTDLAAFAVIIAFGAFRMSAFADRLAKLESSLDAALARVQADTAEHGKEVASLQAELLSAAPTQDELARMDAVQAKLDALDPTKPATLPVDAPVASAPADATSKL